MRKLWISLFTILVVFGFVAYYTSNYYPTIASLVRAPKRAIINVRRNTTPLSKIIKDKKLKINLPLKDPHIEIFKNNRILKFYERNILLKTYPISLGFKPIEDKQKEGDGKTPEGRLFISQMAKSPAKRYLGTRWMRLGYPSKKHAEAGLKKKLINEATYKQIFEQLENFETPLQSTKLGGGIGIHGGSDNIIGGVLVDWTAGCIGLYNSDVEEIYEQVKVGTIVYIFR